MTAPKPSGGDSREILVRLVGEYAIKGMIVLTACLALLGGLVVFLLIAFKEGKLPIEQLIIIAGMGYTAARETYFRGVSKSSQK